MNNKNYIVAFKGKQVDLFDYNGKIIRRFNTKAKVVNAQINRSGRETTVAITMEDSHFEIYTSNGKIIRRK